MSKNLIRDQYDLKQLRSIGQGVQCQIANGSDGYIYLVLQTAAEEIRVPFNAEGAMQLGNLLIQAGLAKAKPAPSD